MKITKRQLRRIIREAMDVGSSGAIPVEDLEFTPGEDGTMNTADYRALDSIHRHLNPGHFEEWKAEVVKRYPGSTAFLEHHQAWGEEVWMPASGPWKDEYDANMADKARSIGRYGSH